MKKLYKMCFEEVYIEEVYIEAKEECTLECIRLQGVEKKVSIEEVYVYNICMYI